MVHLLSFSQWTQLGQDIDGEMIDDLSGRTVSLSGNGNRVLIAAPANDGNGSSSGHARVYEYNGSSWNQLGNDIDGEAAGNQSGWSISISNNGNRIAIGAPSNNSGSGHVRVYEYNGSSWSQLGSDIDGETTGDLSGRAVNLSGDGNRVAIGAESNDDNGYNAGHARVYEYNGSNWVQLGSDIDGESAGDQSGCSVSISNDGSIVAIGARGNDAGIGPNTGHVRVYEYNGNSWNQLGSDIDGEDYGDEFGWSVSMNNDGTVVGIGGPNNYGNGIGFATGHARVYEYNGSNWVQLGSDIDGETTGDQSGWSVSMNDDGTIIAIGALFSGSSWGQVRIYKYNGSWWSQVVSDIYGETAGDQSGSSVSLSSNGATVGIGAPENDGNGNNSGHVRIYNNATLSIQDNSFGTDFSVYPNPSHGLSKIQLGENYNTVSVNVLNVLGKQVASQKYNNTSEVDLNTQEYATGIYFIKVQSGTKGATIKLVVK